MKVGTAPKMTVGATGLIALTIIGFIGLRQMNAPIVEERVYLLPWEEGTVRPRNDLEKFPTDTAQWVENWNNLPQIAAASTGGTEPVDNFFGQPSEMNTAQFTTETKFEIDTMQGFTTNISAPSERAGQSAEDVMYAYFEAWRNSDFKAMGQLMTDQYRRSGHEDPGDEADTNMPDEASDEVIEARRLLTPMLVEALRELQRQSLLVSSEYVGDEFHFRLRTPGSELPGTTDQGMPMFTHTSYNVMKMRKENGVWRVYDTVYDYESALLEIPMANMRSDMDRSDHDNSEIAVEIREVRHESSDGILDEVVEAMAEKKTRQLEPLLVESSREMRSRVLAIDGEYVDDEFHSGLKTPAPKIPGGREHGIEMSVPSLPDTVTKMRKAEGVSRVDEGGRLD